MGDIEPNGISAIREEPKILDGVVITPLKTISVPEGDVYHGIKASDRGFCGFGEAYFSTVKPSTIKSWKRHNRMTLNMIVIVGEIRFVIYDDRIGSPTRGSTQECVLGPDTCYSRLTVPPGLWMAMQGGANGTSILLNVADIQHDPSEIDRCDLAEISYSWGSR